MDHELQRQHRSHEDDEAIGEHFRQHDLGGHHGHDQQGSEGVKFLDNIAAIEALKRIEVEGRRATPEEQRALARYVGNSLLPSSEHSKAKNVSLTLARGRVATRRTSHHRRGVLRADRPLGGAAVAIMPKPKGRIPRANLRAARPITLNDEDWQTIETNYGRSIPTEARAQIIVVTNKFLRWAQAENTGLMQDAVKRADRLRKRARSLMAAINERPIGDVTREYVDDEIALSYSRLEIDDRRFDKRLPTRNYVSWACLELSRFVGACEGALKEFADASQYNYWTAGAYWEAWVRDLTHLLETRRLPTTARKDTDKDKSISYSGTSPFVKFLRAFQNHIPSEYVRAQHSRLALADAIHKARRRSKPFVEPKNSRTRKSGRNTTTTVA